MALEEGGNWESVGEMHGVAVIRADLAAYLETQRTTANTEDARLEDEHKIEQYLASWAPKGAFYTTRLADAFYVNTDPLGKTINNPVVQETEEYYVIVGLATAKSRRFIFLVFTRDTRAVESYILAQAA